MKFKLKTTSTRAELIVITGNATLTETISDLSGAVDESEIEEILTVANELNRFNGNSDLSFVKKVIDAFLNDSEKEELFNTPRQLAEQNKELLGILSKVKSKFKGCKFTVSQDMELTYQIETAIKNAETIKQ